MCLLQLIYVARRGRCRADVLRLSQALRAELSLLVLVAPLAVTNLRAAGPDGIFVGDASNWGIAHAFSQVPEGLGLELVRHTIRMGCWTRLLPPVQQWLLSHDMLVADEVLPGSGLERSMLIWADLAKGLQFVERARKRYKGRRPHINVGEVRASLAVMLFSKSLIKNWT